MSGPRDPFEKQMEQSLAALAPRPGPQLADRTMDRIARTSQRSTRLTRMKHGWARRPLVAVLIGATILVAVAAGNSVLHLLPDHGQASGSRMLSASPPAASPSNGVTPEPSSRAGPIAAWERIDVPDPIVNMLGQAAPSDVVPYGTGYFAVGSIEATCVTDVAQGPAGCAEAIGRLFPDGTTVAAAVWTSPDGRRWSLVPRQSAFEGARMERVATDGARLVVTGMVFDLPIALGQNGYRALWTSDDGVTWMRVDARAGELLPDVIASTSTGWVGARSTSDGPQFLVSQDGMAWDATTAPGEMGAGIVTDLAASTDGMVVAIGDDTAANTDGTLSRAAVVSWRGDDGRMWHRSPPQPSLGGSYPNVAHGSAVIAAGTGWIAVGMVRAVGAAWRSTDGLIWDEPAVIDAAGFGSVDTVAEADGQLVALGTVAGAHGSVIGAWTSPDGQTWTADGRPSALQDGVPHAAIPLGRDAVLVVGSRLAEQDHTVGVAYIGMP